MRKLFPAIALGVATALALAACSGDPADDSSANPSGNPAVGTQPLTIGMPNGTQQNNSNPFTGTSSAMSLGYANAIYEPLVQVNAINSAIDPVPWLATDWTWNDDFTSVTFTVRDGVKWSDGEDLTADDVAYSIQMRKDVPAINTSALPYGDITQSDNTVTVTFTSPQYVNQNKVLTLIVVPKHIWSAIADPTTDLNQNPIGSGPYVLNRWSSEAVSLLPNPNYWGGTPAVPELLYSSYTDNNALTTALVAGDIQWGWTFISDYENVYIAKDSAHNNFWAPSGLGADVLYLNTETKPFNDPAMRVALSMVIDRTAIFEIASEGVFPEVTSVTGMPTPAGDPYMSDAYKGKDYEVDVDGAKAVLADAGYTLKDGKLFDPDGVQVTFTLTDPAGWNDYLTALQQIADAAKALGIDATVDAANVDAWFANIGTGDFQAALHWTDTGATPWDMYSDIMDGAQYVPAGENANWNFGRFQNAEVTAALATYASSPDEGSRTEAMDTIQKVFVEQQPAIIIRARPAPAEFSTKYYVGWPSAENPYAEVQPTRPNVAMILMNLKPAS